MSLAEDYDEDVVIDGQLAALSFVSTAMRGSGADRVVVETRTYALSDGRKITREREIPSPAPAPAEPVKAPRKKTAKKNLFGGKKKKK